MATPATGGSYELLNTLRAAGTNAAPPTVYRALEFLLAQGLIHRIESLNAYTGCVHPGTPHSGQFLVCSGCGAVLEMNDSQVQQAVQRGAEQLGFQVQQQTVEVTGLCRQCRESDHE